MKTLINALLITIIWAAFIQLANADWVDENTGLQWKDIGRFDNDPEFRQATSIEVEEIIAQQDLSIQNNMLNFIKKMYLNGNNSLIFTTSDNITYSFAKHGRNCHRFFNRCVWGVTKTVRPRPFQPIMIKNGEGLKFLPLQSVGIVAQFNLVSSENNPLDNPPVYFRRLPKQDDFTPYPIGVVYLPGLEKGTVFRAEQGEEDDELEIEG